MQCTDAVSASAAKPIRARVGPTTPKRATARGASDHQERPEARSRQPAMMDVINLTGELHHSIETRKQIPACMALQWNETKDETALEKRFGRRHEARRQVWWLSPDDRKWLRFPDRYQRVSRPLYPPRGGRARAVESRDQQSGGTSDLFDPPWPR